MTKANQKDRAAALADLAADFQTEPPRGYPQIVAPQPEAAPVVVARSRAPRAETTAQRAPRIETSSQSAPRVETTARSALRVETTTQPQHSGEKRRPGRPRKEGARMVPFASRLSEGDKEGLAVLAHRLNTSETALLGEAMALLLDKYQRELG